MVDSINDFVKHERGGYVVSSDDLLLFVDCSVFFCFAIMLLWFYGIIL